MLTDDDMDARIRSAARAESAREKGDAPAWLSESEDDDDGHKGSSTSSSALPSSLAYMSASLLNGKRSDGYRLSTVGGGDCCVGCGAALQCADDASPGFLPPHVLERRTTTTVGGDSSSSSEGLGEGEEEEEEEVSMVCQRCHRLRHYGLSDKRLEGGGGGGGGGSSKAADAEDAVSNSNSNSPVLLRPGWSGHEQLRPGFFRDLIEENVRGKKCVVVTIVDVFDFHGSILPDIADLIGRNPLLVAVNKVSYLVSKEKKSKKEEASRASLLSNISSMIFGFVACCENVPLFLPAHPAHHRRRTLS